MGLDGLGVFRSLVTGVRRHIDDHKFTRFFWALFRFRSCLIGGSSLSWNLQDICMWCCPLVPIRHYQWPPVCSGITICPVAEACGELGARHDKMSSALLVVWVVPSTDGCHMADASAKMPPSRRKSSRDADPLSVLTAVLNSFVVEADADD